MVDQDVGRFCAERRKRQGITQVQVSMGTGYSPENISAFENGRTNNMRLLGWYMAHVFTVQDIADMVEVLKNGQYISG